MSKAKKLLTIFLLTLSSTAMAHGHWMYRGGGWNWVAPVVVGGVVGWLWKEHVVYASPQQIITHPEMFDNHGNVIPDEIIAVRFENDYDDNEDEDDE